MQQTEQLPRTERREFAFEMSVYETGDTSMAYVPRDAAMQPGFPLESGESVQAVAIAETCLVLLPEHQVPRWPAVIEIDDPDQLG